MRTGSCHRTTKRHLNWIKTQGEKGVELTHFKRNRPLLKLCDASKQGLGVFLQQNEENNWKPIAYGSRF